MKKQSSFIVMGDLHYEPQDSAVFEKSIEVFNDLEPDFLISLGDLGGYSHPGTKQSFDEAKNLFEKLNCPYYPLVGNHDLEGKEFNTDKANLSSWQNTFQKELPYYSIEFNDFIFVLLSTTRFRQNEYCCHEVFIEEQQFNWLQKIIEQNPNKKILVFSHAPILGSGIRVLQNLHLRSGNAWINQTKNPEKFIQLVNQHPNVIFWASGHNHLSQEYSDSVAIKNNCLFCHAGVVGKISRDGHHQSRFIKIVKDKLKVYTIDHDDETIALNSVYKYKEGKLTLKSAFKTMNSKNFFAPMPYAELENFIDCGHSRFSIQNQMVVEYSKIAKGPIGILKDFISPDSQLRTSNDQIEIWEENNLTEHFHINEMGIYSRPAGLHISEHALSKSKI